MDYIEGHEAEFKCPVHGYEWGFFHERCCPGGCDSPGDHASHPPVPVMSFLPFPHGRG